MLRGSPSFTRKYGAAANELEGRGAVKGDDRVPLLVGRLVNDTVPCESGVVDNNMDLAIAKLCRLLYQLLNVLSAEHVTRDGDG